MKHKNKKRTKRPARNKKGVKQKQARPPAARGVMAIIPYSEIAKPEMYKGKYSIVRTPFNERQIANIISSTPKNVILKRPGKGGGDWSYVPGWWFKKKLNFVFGFGNWSSFIDGERIDGDYITIKGHLTVRDSQGRERVTVSDYGGAEIKFLRGMKHNPENYLDIANDFKAAQTDMLKRCCVQLGFAMDVYGSAESKEMGIAVPGGPNGNGTRVRVEAEVIPPKEEVGIWDEVVDAMKVARKYGAKTDSEFVAFVNKYCKTKITSVRVTRSVAKAVLVELLAKEGKRR